MKNNFASTRLAFILISLLIVHILFSAIIPQKDISEGQIINLEESLGDYYFIIDKLALDRIYTAPPFFVLLGLLALNLTIGNFKRFKTVYKVEKTLLKARHLGSIIFHLSLVLIMFGIILNYLYKFEGVFSLTEGQSSYDTSDGYFRIYKGPLYADDFSNFKLTLDNLESQYQIGDAFTKAAQISIRHNNSSSPITEIIYTNHPLKWNNSEFHFGLFTGYSPEIILKDREDKIILSGFVRMAIQQIKGTQRHADFVLIPELDARLNLELISDNDNPDSSILSVSLESHEKQMFNSQIKIKETVEFDDYILSFPNLRQWCYVSVVKSPFLNLIFFGFWSALAGMTIGFIPRIWKENKNIE